jgi:ubiquinone/menaquinone biosynthesis C-methylase UbiE
MNRKSFWKRPYPYLIALGLLLGIAISFVGPDLTKMDWRKIGSRAGWQLTDRVMASLEIESGDTVADIGAGDGYFTFRLADAVGSTGKVFAVDIEDKLVDTLRRKAEAGNYSQVRVVKGQFDDPLLPDQELDLIFLCNSYHHIQDRTTYFDRLRRDLKPGGRVAIIDLKVSALVRLTVPAGHWTTVESMQEEMQRANYRPIVSFDFLPAQNYVMFSPLSTADNAPKD